MKKQFISDNLKWALSYLKPYTWGLLGVFILTFGQNYSFALLPSVSTKFLFELITPEKIHLLYKYFGIAVALIFSRAVFNFLKKNNSIFKLHILIEFLVTLHGNNNDKNYFI